MSASNPVQQEDAAIFAANKALLDAVKARDEAAIKVKEKLDNDLKAKLEQQKAETHAMQIVQQLSQARYQAEIAEIAEQRKQLGVTVDTPAPTPEVTAPPITPPAQPVEVVVPIPEPATPTVTTTISVTPEPQEALGLPKSQDATVKVNVTTSYDHNPRKWSGRQWLMAIILGLIGLFIGLQTVNWLVSSIGFGWPEWITAIVQVIFGFLWVIAWTVFGFQLGSWVGFKASQKYKKNKAEQSAA